MKLTTLTISLILCCCLLDGAYGNVHNLHRRKNENLRTPDLVRSHDVDTNGEDPWWDDENEYLSGDDIIRKLPDVMDEDPRSRTERVDYKDMKTSDDMLNKDDKDWNIQEKSNFDDDGDWDEQVKYESFKSDGNRNEDEKENFDDDQNLDVEQEDDDPWNEQELAYNTYEDNGNNDDYWAQQEYNNFGDDGWEEQNYDTEDANTNVDDVDYGNWGEQEYGYNDVHDYENDNWANEEDGDTVGSWDRPTGVSNDNTFEEGRYKRQLSAANSDFYFVEGEESSIDDSGCTGPECSDEREDGGITSPERDGSFLDLGSDSSSDYLFT